MGATPRFFRMNTPIFVEMITTELAFNKIELEETEKTCELCKCCIKLNAAFEYSESEVKTTLKTNESNTAKAINLKEKILACNLFTDKIKLLTNTEEDDIEEENEKKSIEIQEIESEPDSPSESE